MNVRAEVRANGTTHAEFKRQENAEANSNPPCNVHKYTDDGTSRKRLAELEVRRSIQTELRAQMLNVHVTA
jgi:hypothetical protein